VKRKDISVCHKLYNHGIVLTEDINAGKVLLPAVTKTPMFNADDVDRTNALYLAYRYKGYNKRQKLRSERTSTFITSCMITKAYSLML
jgi:hypothetical protein